MDNWEEQKKPRVLGSMLATNTYNGKVVTVLGKVVGNVDPSGKWIMFQTTDNYKLQVHFDPPLMEPVSGWLEFQGRVVNKSEMSSLNYVSFSDDMMKPFDPDLFNRTIEIYDRNIQK